jgi:prolyl 4-hydroxylase
MKCKICEDGDRMRITVKLSAELRHWIDHNLDRGCAPEQLVQSMMAQSFEPDVARGVISGFVQARAAGRPIAGDSLVLDTPDPGYVADPSRLAAGNSLWAGDRSVSVLLRLTRPTIVLLGEVLDARECDELIALARPRLTPSTVVDPVTGVDQVVDHRDSEGMFFRLNESPFIGKLDRRIARLMGAPLEHGEGLQVLRYGPGAKTTPHFDFLLPSNPANVASLARSGQRISSLVIYLNDVAQGGETAFPEIGVAVNPRRGHAVCFEYCNTRGEVDPLSLHAGQPVAVGQKWVATKWMRQRRFVPA